MQLVTATKRALGTVGPITRGSAVSNYVERLIRQAKATSGNAIVSMALELERYAGAYQDLYDDKIARDGTLAVAFLVMLQALTVLLRGELGVHDREHLAQLIRDVARASGFTDDDLTQHSL